MYKFYISLLLIFTPLIVKAEIYEELHCLALNIYFEARSSNLADQAAVADVVLNRVESSNYPNSICEVVYQAKLWNGKPVHNKCQFSWYCDGKSDIPKNKDAWEKAKLIAIQIYKYNIFRGIAEGATMYHATYITPYWAKDYQLIGTIGKHRYYRKLSKY